ncbi:MAG TPA: hypothetical protein VGT05_04375 [Patescibacteria group bacterium]|nr:hypothetical protein [Patescibacteria group bacterium]
MQKKEILKERARCVGAVIGGGLLVEGINLVLQYRSSQENFSLSAANWQSPEEGQVTDKVRLAVRAIISDSSYQAGWRLYSFDFTTTDLPGLLN